ETGQIPSVIEPFELTTLVNLATPLALYLSARGARNGTRPDEHEIEQPQSVIANDAFERRLGCGVLAVTIPDAAGDLLHDDKLLGLRSFNRECRPGHGRIGFVAASHAGLDVLRGMIRAADDDRILHAAYDKKLAILDQTEVAGVHIAVAGSLDRYAEGTFAALPVAPVPKRD